jgi:hypothetical protein
MTSNSSHLIKKRLVSRRYLWIIWNYIAMSSQGKKLLLKNYKFSRKGGNERRWSEIIWSRLIHPYFKLLMLSWKIILFGITKPSRNNIYYKELFVAHRWNHQQVNKLGYIFSILYCPKLEYCRILYIYTIYYIVRT